MIDYKRSNIKLWSRLGSCGAFGVAANELAQTSDDILMITSDLCFYSGLNRFKSKYPDRLYNCGIAEQNMVGVAAGLAKEGFVPFATTYATFAAARCADQVRVNMGYMKLNMKLVGLTAGVSVGILGPTHISIEDIAIIRSIPNIIILSPADCTETVKATIAAAKIDAPVYLRLSGPMNNPVVYNEDYEFEIGKAIELKDGDDVSIIATGTMVYNSLKASEILDQKYSIKSKVIDMHTIKPLDTQIIDQSCKNRLLVTVEEHSKIGGLGSAVAEYLSEKSARPPQLIIGFCDEYKHAASYDYLINQYELEPEQIAEKIALKYKNMKG